MPRMVFDPESWESNFPKFLIGDSPGRTFVVHLHRPRFVAEVFDEWDGESIEPKWLDQPLVDAAKLAALMREAGDFYIEEIEREPDSI
jgi:hypothetical protein